VVEESSGARCPGFLFARNKYHKIRLEGKNPALRRRKLLHLLWIVPLLLILGAGAYIYFLYTTLNRPYLADIETDFVVPHDLHTAHISHVFKIVNDNDISLHVDSLYYKIYLDGIKYGEGKRTQDFTIKANDTTDVALQYPFDLDRFINTYEKTGKDSAVHQLVFDFYVDLWRFKSIHLPYTYEKNMAVFKRPTVKVEKVKLTKFGLKESRLEADVFLHNPSEIMFDTYSMRYTLDVGGVQVAKGGISKDEILRQKSSLHLSMPIKVDVKDLLKKAGLLKKGFREQSYTVSFHIELKPPPEKNVPTSDFDIVSVGKVSDLIEDYKEEKAEAKEKKK
jgi:LEA14-like dessication related protein